MLLERYLKIFFLSKSKVAKNSKQLRDIPRVFLLNIYYSDKYHYKSETEHPSCRQNLFLLNLHILLHRLSPHFLVNSRVALDADCLTQTGIIRQDLMLY